MILRGGGLHKLPGLPYSNFLEHFKDPEVLPSSQSKSQLLSLNPFHSFFYISNPPVPVAAKALDELFLLQSQQA